MQPNTQVPMLFIILDMTTNIAQHYNDHGHDNQVQENYDPGPGDAGHHDEHIEDEDELHLGMKIDSGNEKRQISKLEQFRQKRDQEIVSESLEKLRETCNGDENIMPQLIEALKLGATVGEVNGIMREVFGTWVSPSGV